MSHRRKAHKPGTRYSDKEYGREIRRKYRNIGTANRGKNSSADLIRKMRKAGMSGFHNRTRTKQYTKMSVKFRDPYL